MRLFGKRQDPPAMKRNVALVGSTEEWNCLCMDSYKPLWQCPEVRTCVEVYAQLIGSMTVYVMQNAEMGDLRIKNGLSRKLDVDPCKTMTRMSFIGALVKAMLYHGNAYCIPEYSKEGYLENLWPLSPTRASLMRSGENGYTVLVDGKPRDPDTLLHFPYGADPELPWKGNGLNISLSDAVRSIRQSNATKLKLMESPKPSLIVKVDGLTGDLERAAGRKKLREQYLDTSEDGTPWMIPAETMSVEQVRPLTIADLAIRDGLELDKKAIASALGVPTFLLGIGSFNKDEFNFFLRTRVMALAKIIEQEMTKKLIVSPEMYVKFNARSLMAYDIGELVTAGATMVDHMAMTRNEWRDWVGLAPRDEMEELLSLENYIPADRLGDQKKLKDGGE